MLYQKIEGLWTRDVTTHKVVKGQFRNPVVRDLFDAPVWHVTEKIDGMNIRVLWDGYSISFGGRTDRAELPAQLVEHLKSICNEGIFEATFEDKPAVIFGEGFGPKIQSGGKYGDEVEFAVFDVAINGRYLRPDDALQLAYESLGFAIVPMRTAMRISTALEHLETRQTSRYGDFQPEGYVAKTTHGLLDHRGNRIAVKIKPEDVE